MATSRKSRRDSQLKRQKQCTQAQLQLLRLSEEHDEQSFLQRSLKILEDLTGSQVSFLHFVNDDEETLELVAWSQRTIDHYCHAAFDKHYPVSRAGVWADAVRQRAPVVCNDYASYPGKMGLPDGHAELVRFVSVPVIAKGKIVMLTGVGNSADTYDGLDLETVQLISSDVWSIIQRIRDQQALQASLREKTALLMEVHHRVKNNLQVISSLLSMENRRSNQSHTKAALTDMQGRIYSMALLHESLYRSGTFASVDLGMYLKQLATQSFRTQQNGLQDTVRLQFDVTSVSAGMDQATACGLLVNELVSNCLKHGFPPECSGAVKVELQPAASHNSQVDALWRLCVSDNGVGLPPDFEVRRKMSLGLQLVDDLSRQIHGTLKIQSEPGAGAEFAVFFKALAPVKLVMPLGESP